MFRQDADARDLDLDDLAVGERADAGRRAGQDDVARQQRQDARTRTRRSSADGVHHVARAGPYWRTSPSTRVSIVASVEVELGLDDRAERAERVVALRAGPLAVGLLQVAGRDVVRDRVAEDDVARSLRAARSSRSLPITMASSPSCSTCARLSAAARSRRPARSPRCSASGRAAARPARRRPSRPRGRGSSCRRATTFERGMTGASSFASASGTRSPVVSKPANIGSPVEHDELVVVDDAVRRSVTVAEPCDLHAGRLLESRTEPHGCGRPGVELQRRAASSSRAVGQAAVLDVGQLLRAATSSARRPARRRRRRVKSVGLAAAAIGVMTAAVPQANTSTMSPDADAVAPLVDRHAAPLDPVAAVLARAAGCCRA